MKTRRDVTGQRFGRLVVLFFHSQEAGKHSKWFCRCDCGKEKVILLDSLRSGRTQSCGCLQREKVSQWCSENAPGRNHKGTHGLCYEPEYRVWNAMIQRCENPNDKRFSDWGGRGISVCERWHNFANFYADMGARPSPKLSIDRIDNDRGYEPGNCRWATAHQQVHNRRKVQL
jgi:hypothetical protein